MAAIDQLFGFDFADEGLSPDARRRLGVAQSEASRGAARSVAAALGQGSTNPLAASNAYQEATRDARTGALRTVLEQEAQRRAAQTQMARQVIGSLITSGGQAVGMAIPAAQPLTNAATGAASSALGSSGAVAPLTGTPPPAGGASPAVARLLQAPPSAAAPARASAPLTAAPTAASPAPVAPSTPDTSAVGQLLRSSLGSGPLIAPPATPTQASLTGAAPPASVLVGTGVRPVPRPAGALPDDLDELARLFPGSVVRVR